LETTFLKRLRQSINQNVELVNVSNVDEKTIRRSFAGEQNVSVKVLQRICEVLGADLATFFPIIKG
jgi:transcriptional regulator with XRE-family HTH domain